MCLLFFQACCSRFSVAQATHQEDATELFVILQTTYLLYHLVINNPENVHNKSLVFSPLPLHPLQVVLLIQQNQQTSVVRTNHSHTVMNVVTQQDYTFRIQGLFFLSVSIFHFFSSPLYALQLRTSDTGKIALGDYLNSTFDCRKILHVLTLLSPKPLPGVESKHLQ